MKVPNVIIKPPSLVSRLEGKANKALIQKVEEINQKVLEEKKEGSSQNLKKARLFLLQRLLLQVTVHVQV